MTRQPVLDFIWRPGRRLSAALLAVSLIGGATVAWAWQPDQNAADWSNPGWYRAGELPPYSDTGSGYSADAPYRWRPPGALDQSALDHSKGTGNDWFARRYQWSGSRSPQQFGDGTDSRARDARLRGQRGSGSASTNQPMFEDSNQVWWNTNQGLNVDPSGEWTDAQGYGWYPRSPTESGYRFRDEDKAVQSGPPVSSSSETVLGGFRFRDDNRLNAGRGTENRDVYRFRPLKPDDESSDLEDRHQADNPPTDWGPWYPAGR